MAKHKELVDLEYRYLVHETEAAYLFDFEEKTDPVWIPKSQCEVDENKKIVTTSAHLAEQKDLEDYAI